MNRRENKPIGSGFVWSGGAHDVFDTEWGGVAVIRAGVTRDSKAHASVVESPCYDQAVRAVWEGVHTTIGGQIDRRGVHIWPFDPALPVDVRLFYYEKTTDVRMNRHDYCELLFLYSGEITMQVQHRRMQACPGDLVVIGSTSFHRVVEFSKPGVQIWVLYFMPELLRGADVEYLLPFLVQDERFPHVVPAQTGLPAEIFRLMERIQAELPAATKADRLYVKTCLKMSLAALVRHYSSYRSARDEFGRKQRNIQRLQPVLDWIDAHFQEPLTIGQAAALAGASEAHFTRLFRAVTGQSFLKYLNHHRIARAQSLLAATDKSVAEIAVESGFYDHSHFGLMFRKLVHSTPREYRRQIAGDGGGSEDRD